MNLLKWLTTISLFIAMPAQLMATNNYEYNVTCEPDNCCPEPVQQSEPSCCLGPQSNMCCPSPCNTDCCYQPCFETPCYTSSRKSTIGYAVIGAILIAGAGAAIGYAAGNNNDNKQCCQPTRVEKRCNPPKDKCCCKHKEDKCCCDQEICFLQDLNEELTFEICLAPDGNHCECNRCCCSSCSCCSSCNSIKVTSFCVDPLGNMKTGKTQTVDCTQLNYGCCTSSLYSDKIRICNPFYGTYNFGVQIEFCNNPPASSFCLTGEVNASKTHTTTTIPVSTTPGICQADFIQYTGEFSYAPEAGVPSR